MKKQLTSVAKKIVKQVADIKDVSVTWTLPQQGSHGDLSTPVALQISKAAGKPPREIADSIASALKDVEGVQKVEVAGAGYVNVWLEPDALLKDLSDVQDACFPSPAKDEKPIIVDYCGPNIAKPLGVHHLGSHIIGQAIINLYKHAGHNVIGWSYPGDWGTQFGKLAIAHDKWDKDKKPSDYTIEELLALYVRFHAEAEKDPSLDAEARNAFWQMEEGNVELLAFREAVAEVSLRSLQVLYDRLHIHVDRVTGESFYQDKMKPILDEGIKKGVFKEGEVGKEGNLRALIVEFPEESGLPPFLVRKSDGSTLYATRDLAMIRYRIYKYKPQAIYYVVDVAQSLHFKQLKATCDQLKWKMPEFEHTLFGRMRFKDASMSTRKGTVLRLEEVVDEAVERAKAVIKEHGDQVKTDDPDGLAEIMGVGAVAYGILSQNRKQDIVFDWSKMLSFEGNSAPYLQYTHARTRSVLSKAGLSLEDAKIPTDVLELSEHERVLTNTLLQFPQILEEACTSRMPHILTNYLFLLCQTYNSFYNAEPILQSDEPQRSLRLALTAHTAAVLKAGAGILTLQVPDSM